MVSGHGPITYRSRPGAGQADRQTITQSDGAVNTMSGKSGKKSPRGAYASLTSEPRTQAAAAISAIKEYILKEELQPGDPLPTESKLCADLRRKFPRVP